MRSGGAVPPFLGLKRPSPGRPIRTAVIGCRSPFLDALLHASTLVELYDEELGIEPYRRGIVTERLAPARIAGRMDVHRRQGRFLLVVADLPPGQALPGPFLTFAPAGGRDAPRNREGESFLLGWRRGRPPAGASRGGASTLPPSSPRAGPSPSSSTPTS